MSILQKYVLREMLTPLGLGLIVFTFIFLIGQLFRLTDLLFSMGVPGLLIIELILSLLPGIFAITIPMALLVAILLGIGRLAADREILAIRMSGINIMHVCLPVMGVSVFLAVAMIYANMRIVPYLNLKSADLATQIQFRILSNIPENRFYHLDEGTKSSVYFYDYRDTHTNEMRNVNIKTDIESDETPAEEARRKMLRAEIEKLPKQRDTVSLQRLEHLREQIKENEAKRSVQETMIVAQRGRVESDMAERLISIKLTSGSLNIVDPARPQSLNMVKFDTLSKAIRPQFQRTEDGAFRKAARELSITELRGEMNQIKSKRRGLAVIEFWQRFSFPVACIAFVLIAIPLAVYVRPTGKAIAFAIAFLLILTYYGLLNYGITLGTANNSIAGPAIFVPNILISIVGSFLLYRMVMK
ncbi:MAG: LptF/LptG family permease [bacterium]